MPSTSRMIMVSRYASGSARSPASTRASSLPRAPPDRRRQARELLAIVARVSARPLRAHVIDGTVARDREQQPGNAAGSAAEAGGRARRRTRPARDRRRRETARGRAPWHARPRKSCVQLRKRRTIAATRRDHEGRQVHRRLGHARSIHRGKTGQPRRVNRQAASRRQEGAKKRFFLGSSWFFLAPSWRPRRLGGYSRSYEPARPPPAMPRSPARRRRAPRRRPRDSRLDQRDVEAERLGVERGVLDAVVGREAEHADLGDAARAQPRLEVGPRLVPLSKSRCSCRSPDRCPSATRARSPRAEVRV